MSESTAPILCLHSAACADVLANASVPATVTAADSAATVVLIFIFRNPFPNNYTKIFFVICKGKPKEVAIESHSEVDLFYKTSKISRKKYVNYMLKVESLVKDFGGLRAVDGTTFDVKKGTITGLIGPNGAGKTTTFNAIAGEFPITSGKIVFDGEDISALPSYETFKRGLVRTFQIPKPFGGMTVLENLMMVPKGQLGERFWNNWIRPKAVMEEELRIRDEAVKVMDFLNLTQVAEERGGNLSGGQMKLLELGRALMSDPKMVMLDEPGAGVNPTLLGEIVEKIAELNRRGLTFLIIEHNMDLIMNLCDPILVMASGEMLMQGTASEVQNDARVLEAFLGGVVEEET